MAQDRFGVCENCGYQLEPEYFLDEETIVTRDGYLYKTGRVRTAVDYLICPNCLAKYCVDDSFDGPWH